MGRVRHEWKTPKKSRSFGLLEHSLSIPATATEFIVRKGAQTAY
jgi:hypothetical protein